MKKIITNVQKYELGDSYEIRVYERGCWQHDIYVKDFEEAVERMNFLISQYDCWVDDVQLVKLTYFENITEDAPF